MHTAVAHICEDLEDSELSNSIWLCRGGGGLLGFMRQPPNLSDWEDKTDNTNLLEGLIAIWWGMENQITIAPWFTGVELNPLLEGLKVTDGESINDIYEKISIS